METKKTIFSIIETLIVNIGVYVVFFILQPNQEVYLQLNPHPLFLLSIVMGLRYGNYLGLISASISSLFYIKGFLSLYGDITLLFGEFNNYKYLLLFFWSAIILGFFKDNKDAIIEKLTNDKKSLLKEYKKVSKNYKTSKKIQQELKKQIIVSDESILNLYEIASRLETLDSEEVYTETIGILSKYLNANQVSIYTYIENSGFLRPKIHLGESKDNNRSLSIRDSLGLSIVVNEKKAVRWSDVNEDGFPLMAAPIIKEDKVLAVVNIDNMKFDALSEYAFQLFKLIIDWVNRALARAIYVDGLKGSRYVKGTKLYKYKAFLERLKAEERRKQEFGMDFCLLKYRVRKLTLDVIGERMYSVLRSVDVISYDRKSMIIYVLLPATPKDKLYLVDKRIHSHFGDYIEPVEEIESKLVYNW